MRIVYPLFFVVLICSLSLISYQLAFSRFENSARSTSVERLSLYQATLRSTLARVSHLPRVVVLHPFTKEVLRQGKSVASFNEYLKSVSDQAGSAALYVLDRSGTTVAASNFDTDESFVGNNYKFRRYYSDAVVSGTGDFFAVGVTTGRPGYFLSEAIYQGGKPVGVAVVKVEFKELLRDWKGAGENVLITNNDGVIVLASNPGKLYKTLGSISPDRMAEMKESRKFSGYELQPLSYTSETDTFEKRVQVDGEDFSVSTVNTDSIGWKLHYLTPLEPVRNSALAFAAMAFLLGGLTGIGLLYARARVERSKLQITAIEAERVRKVNVRLEKEIAERKRTEERLRDTQAELIQSSRLAALGKMSAAIVHEVNQPVSAIRTYTSSGLLLLGNRKIKDARDVFSQIRNMTERLGSITSDLLVFSRKPVAKPAAVDLNACIETIVTERAGDLTQIEAKVKLDLWKKPLFVTGSEHRFQQLIGNLLQNAIHACEGTEAAEICITTIADPKSAVVIVGDNGCGIPEEIMDQLFDPFFTTKGVGKGVGLGLALSYAIADEAGGRIRCENREGRGARFILELPISVQQSKDRERQKTDG
ncbi:MAG: sensor histidine kinase [Rhizobiaceae bacterium]